MEFAAKYHIIVAFLIGLCGFLEASVCLSYPRCYCSNKGSIKILCKNVTDLSPIEELLERYPRIYSLRIYGQNLTKLPSKLFSGKSMIALEVAAPLSEISDDALSDIEDLQIVNFDGGRFVSVPDAFRNSSFRIVQLVGGELSRIGTQLQNNTQATDFLLSENRVSGIDSNAFSNVPSLQTLNLSRNEIRALDPSVFRRLSGLKSVDLSLNRLFTLDGYFENLNPQKILLYGNNLSNVDNAFLHSMWSVKYLDLGGNPNLNLSTSTFQGKMRYLSALGLNDNNFENFDPLILKNFRSLHKLYLNGNRISVVLISNFSSNPYLSVLEVASNNISSTESLFPLDHFRPARPNLKTVRLDGNRIGSLVFGSTAKSVLHLDLGSNDIHRLDSVDLENLTLVSTLNLSGNPLSEMEDSCFRHQLKLKILDLSFTRLKSLNHSLRNLVDPEDLRVASSSLTAPKDLRVASSSLTAPEELRVASSSLETLQDLRVAASSLTALEDLRIASSSLAAPEDLRVASSLLTAPEDLRVASSSLAAPEDLRVVSLSLVTPEDLRIASSSLTAPEALRVASSSLAAPEDLRIVSLSLVTPEDLRIASSSLTAPEDLRVTSLSLVTPEDLRIASSSLTAPEDLRVASSSLTAPEDLRVESSSLAAPEDLRVASSSLSTLVNLRIASSSLAAPEDPRVASSSLATLEDLRVESSSLTALEDDELASLGGLKILSLRNNSLNSVDGAMKKLSNLISLDISRNNLTTLTSNSLPFDDKGFIGLKKLWMEGNPWSCDCRLIWLLEWLKAKSSRLEDEPTCWSPPHLNGTRLRSLNLTDLQVWKTDDCPSDCDCNCFQEGRDFFTAVNCSGRALKNIPDVFPENAREVDLSYNDIHSVDSFKPGLNMKLRILNLDGNDLERVSLSSFPKSLEFLGLAGNNISRFPIEDWDGAAIAVVNLSRNPWICDCKAWNFRQWLVSHSESVEDLNEVRCATKGVLKDSIIIHLNFDDMCKNTQVTKIAIVTVTIVLFIAVCIAAYLFRKALVVLCYSCGCHCLKAGEKHLYSFDAFFLYADEDEELALGTIAEGLEAQPMGFKLFIPTRHVFLASPAADIESSLSECCKVIVLLTKDFLQNAQCMQLLKSSMSCSITTTSRRMIFVTQIDARSVAEMDPVLGSVMRNSVQLHWGTCLFWQKLGFHMPKKSRRQEMAANEESQPFLDVGC